MAIARMMAVKKFRRQLLSMRHPHVANWTDKRLKNAVFRNSEDWIELLRWLLGELDIEIQECLCNCTDEERVTRIKESVMVLGLSGPENVNTTVEGRVVFKEREELVSQLIDLVKMKKALDSGVTPCLVESNGLQTEDGENAKSGDSDAGSSSRGKKDVLSGRELFFLLLEKHPEYQRLMFLATGEGELPQEDNETTEGEDDFQETGGEGQSTMKKDSLGVNNPSSSSSCEPTSQRPKIRKCSCGKEIVVAPVLPRKPVVQKKSFGIQTSDDEEQMLTPANVSTEAKEGCNEDLSLQEEVNDEIAINDGDESNMTKVRKSGVDKKPLNYLEAVHDMVDCLERTFHVTE